MLKTGRHLEIVWGGGVKLDISGLVHKATMLKQVQMGKGLEGCVSHDYCIIDALHPVIIYRSHKFTDHNFLKALQL